MSIASSLEALAQAKADIADAIVAQGGTVGEGDGFADFAADIATITIGGNVETAEVTLDAFSSNISYTPTEVTNVSGAIIFAKYVVNTAPYFAEHTKTNFVAYVNGDTWGGWGGLYSGSYAERVGPSYGDIQLPAEGSPSIIFKSKSSPSTQGFNAGTYQVIVWGDNE